MTSPSPRYCLRLSPAGYWYLIPVIQACDWERWCKAVRTSARGAARTFPKYAQPTQVEAISFEDPKQEVL